MWNPCAPSRMGPAVLVALACAWAGAREAAPGRARPAAASGSPGLRPAQVVTELPGSRKPNHPPRFLSTAPRTAREGRGYVYELAASDPDGDTVAFSLLRAPEGAVLEGEVLKWTPTLAQAGQRQRFTLRAVDEHGAVSVQHWSVIPDRSRERGVLGVRRTRH